MLNHIVSRDVIYEHVVMENMSSCLHIILILVIVLSLFLYFLNNFFPNITIFPVIGVGTAYCYALFVSCYASIFLSYVICMYTFLLIICCSYFNTLCHIYLIRTDFGNICSAKYFQNFLLMFFRISLWQLNKHIRILSKQLLNRKRIQCVF